MEQASNDSGDCKLLRTPTFLDGPVRKPTVEEWLHPTQRQL